MVMRLRQPQVEAVSYALDLVPERIRELLEFDLFCGDVVFSCITVPRWATERAPTGGSYRTLAHVQFPYHSRDRRTTICLPSAESAAISTVLHEMGHALHWSLQERAGGWGQVPQMAPVSEYAHTNELEAFAEAFTSTFYPTRQLEADPYWTGGVIRANDEFFDRLGAR